MAVGFVIRKNEYYDSVFLMRVARRLSEQKGILQAAALMGTERNKELLADLGIGGAAVSSAGPTDLILALRAEDQETLAPVLADADRWLHPDLNQAGVFAASTLDEALIRLPGANLAAISVPGEYAAAEARRALDKGLNVFLFSDNVSIESERSLKELARERGLIVMGPDCGTAIIRGVGIGFANVVRPGPVGVIGASGTGIQEFTTLIHRAGGGISHAIGTGGRDLSDVIGGISLLAALDALESDPRTEVIAVLSKPPGPKALARVLPRILSCPKPVVVCFLGLAKDLWPGRDRIRSARTLDEAAALAVEITTGAPPPPFDADPSGFQPLLKKERAGMKNDQRFIRGLFAGGTFCYQAQQVLRDAGLGVYSNSPLEGNRKLPDSGRSAGHTLLDMGADEFTSGKPHPMIDSRPRGERILAEARDPEVAILLLDLILGYNASPDPAGELAPSIAEAKNLAGRRGGFLSVIASICGTEGDPQGLQRQAEALQELGVIVFSSSARAALFGARLARSLAEAADDPGT